MSPEEKSHAVDISAAQINREEKKRDKTVSFQFTNRVCGQTHNATFFFHSFMDYGETM